MCCMCITRCFIPPMFSVMECAVLSNRPTGIAGALPTAPPPNQAAPSNTTLTFQSCVTFTMFANKTSIHSFHKQELIESALKTK